MGAPDQDNPPVRDRRLVLEAARDLSGLLAATDEAVLADIAQRRAAVDVGLAALGARQRAGEVVRWDDDVEPVLGDLMALVANEWALARRLATAAAVLVQMVEHVLVATDDEVERRAAALLLERTPRWSAALPVQ